MEAPPVCVHVKAHAEWQSGRVTAHESAATNERVGEQTPD